MSDKAITNIMFFAFEFIGVILLAAALQLDFWRFIAFVIGSQILTATMILRGNVHDDPNYLNKYIK